MTTTTITTFDDFGLIAPVLAAVREIGYEVPSPIQLEAIPSLLAGRDLIGQAQTGTGKTAAFALPLLSRLDLSLRKPQILVLTPTRELAIQVGEAMQAYARKLGGFHVLPVYGGQGMVTQLRQLSRGVHVVVGTPGRVQDHLRRGTLKLDRLTAVVLDEADEMLRMGFIDDVKAILEHTPETRQIALFSATMPAAIRSVANAYLRDPVVIKIHSKTATVATVTQQYWEIPDGHKLTALTRLLEVEEFEAMLIFVRTKNATVDLSERLEARGFASAPLSGDLTQAVRERTVERLKSGALDIVVATDVAARGLHVERISHVLNFDVPYDTEAYVHRIGRTARAGREGRAILFVSPRERSMLRAIERATGQRIDPIRLPSAEEVTGKRVARFKQTISEALDTQDLAPFATIVTDYAKEHDVEVQSVAAALAYLAQRERPLKTSTPDVPVPAPAPSSRAPRHSGAPGAAREDRTRSRRRSAGDAEAVPMVTYRIEVGREHGALPNNIVGAIANEAGLESRYIGAVKIQGTFSTVELPEGMPRGMLEQLKKVRVRGRSLGITLVNAGRSPRPSPKRG